MLGDRAGSEPAVEGEVPRSDPEPLELGAGGRQQVGLVRRLRRSLARLPVNRLLSAWDLSYAIVVVAVIALIWAVRTLF